MKKTLLILVANMILFIGCSRNDLFLANLEKYVYEIQSKYNELTDEDWVKLNEEFNERIAYRFDQIKDGFSQKELNKSEDLMDKFRALQIAHRKEIFFRDLEKFVSEAEDRFDDQNYEEWLKQENQFSERLLAELKILREDFTDEEKTRSNELIGKYINLQVKRDLKSTKFRVMDFLEQWINVMKEWLHTSVYKDDAVKNSDSLTVVIQDHIFRIAS